MKKFDTRYSITSFFIALIILTLWAASLIFMLTRKLSTLHSWQIPLAILWQALFYTGLFVTAHDAMHGNVFPANRKINHAIGTVIIFVYAQFKYKNLMTKHWEHHKHPASQQDPDFHDGVHTNLFQWYGHFMRNYITWKQLLGMAILFNALLYLLHVPLTSFLLFLAVPSLLSTLQLFYFGTVLPHRESATGYKDKHRARSVRMPLLLSFLTCYHFSGYYWEHHAHPNVAWWRLPATRVSPV